MKDKILVQDKGVYKWYFYPKRKKLCLETAKGHVIYQAENIETEKDAKFWSEEYDQNFKQMSR